MRTEVNYQKPVANTADCLGEYTQRIAQVIDGEKKKAKELGEQESSRIIAEARQLAQQITEEAMAKAEVESARYMTELSQKAEQRAAALEKEALSKVEEESARIIANSFDEADQILVKAAQAAEEEASNIRTDSLKGAEQIISEARGRAAKEAGREAGEARSKILREFDECARVINEAKQKLEQAVKVADETTGKESEHLSEVAAQPNFAEEKAEAGEPMVQVQASFATAEVGSTEFYRGEVEVEVTAPGGFGQMARFMENLRKVPSIGLKSLGGHVEGKTTAVLAIGEPLPLTSIIKGMPQVEGVVEQGNKIKVALRIGEAR